MTPYPASENDEADCNVSRQCLQRLQEMRQNVSYPGLAVTGSLSRFSGHLITATGCIAQRGEVCHVETADGEILQALATGFDGNETHLFAFDHQARLLPGATVSPQGYGQRAPVGYGLLGRVVDRRGAGCWCEVHQFSGNVGSWSTHRSNGTQWSG